MNSRIIFIPGILTVPELHDFAWGRAAVEMFPDREVTCIKKMYVYTQHETIRALKQEVLAVLADGEPTIIVGHSFGGIIAIAAAQEAARQGLDNITRVVTLATPHSMNAPGLKEARQAVGYQYESIDIPLYTQGARFDHVVPRRFTHFPGAEHREVWSSHSGFWLNPRSWRYRHMWNSLRD